MNEKELKIAEAVRDILSLIGEEPDREGLRDTPKRVAKMLSFLTKGYRQKPEDILNNALFDTKNSDIVLLKDIEFYSMCEHHILPIIGTATIAYIPNRKVIGLSKIARVVEVYARRLQLQERLSENIATGLSDLVNAKGVAVRVEARHMCMEMRGVEKRSSTTITTSFKGEFKEVEKRKEFFEMIR